MTAAEGCFLNEIGNIVTKFCDVDWLVYLIVYKKNDMENSNLKLCESSDYFRTKNKYVMKEILRMLQNLPKRP